MKMVSLKKIRQEDIKWKIFSKGNFFSFFFFQFYGEKSYKIMYHFDNFSNSEDMTTTTYKRKHTCTHTHPNDKFSDSFFSWDIIENKNRNIFLFYNSIYFSFYYNILTIDFKANMLYFYILYMVSIERIYLAYFQASKYRNLLWELIFYLLQTFCPHLGSFFVLFLLSLRFGQISPLAFFGWFTTKTSTKIQYGPDSGRPDKDL